MQVINSNIMSLNAQRNLSNTGADLATSLQRLSSGLRINSAKDDAAGLAISERFTTQIRGMDQAARNANDGISLAQTAEGAMGEIGNNLQRIRELAVQSRNATNSASDREALNKEAQQLKSEIDRVATQTSFNGVKLLDGSFQDQTFQVGANQGETITVASITDASSDALGSWTSVATANTTASSGAFADVTLAAANDEFSITVDGETAVAITAAGANEVVDAAAIDAELASNAATLEAAGITFTGSAADGDLAFSKADGSAFDVVVANDAGADGFAGADFATGTNSVDNGAAAAAQTGFGDLDISTVEGADAAMLAMDGALTALNTARADMGAVQNRFSSVVANLSSNSENLSAARSRIQDADFAKETAQLTRNQILQQAGTAMLAQANQAPQGVLSLLR
ncbi:MAG: flagellin [Lysobacterales bacterium RIFOXYD1_FULL_69_11]|nr:MAG: flagellin [Xanthomonadales bacterium RIFOXYA1_FULL_69_10]OHE88497.1 MAG: flagellin [Xanthomonadales bacterium RIFOXYD1_FULL_69_11]